MNKKTKSKSKLKPKQAILNKSVHEVETVESKPLKKDVDSWLDSLIRSKFHWLVLVMALLFAGVRFSFYSTSKNSLLYEQYLGPETDNFFFLDWAKKLPDDWFQNRPIHPYHFWHKDFAKDYFKRHPKEEKKFQLASSLTSDSISAGQLLWNKWYKEKVFHQEPLYPYILAFFIKIGLDPVDMMLIVQLILGIAGGVLLMLVTKSNFGYTASFFSGIIYLLCGIILYNEIILLRTSWSVFFTILVVYMLDRVIKSNNRKVYFVAGCIFGLAYLMQSTFVLFLIFGLFIVFYLNRKNRNEAIKKSIFLISGFTLLILPLVIRNIYTGCPILSESSVGPITFIVPNAYPSFSYANWFPQAQVHTVLFEQGFNSISDAIRITLGTHTGLESLIELMYEKLRSIWIGFEYPNNENFYLYKENFTILQSLFLDFFIIAPLSLAGLLLAIYKRKTTYSLYVAVAFHLLIMLTFYVLARFRAPLVIVAIPFMAYLFSELIKISKERLKFLTVLLAITGIFFFLSFKNYSKAQEDKFLSGEAYRNVFTISLQNKLESLSYNSRWNEWLKTQNKIFTIEPEFIRNIEYKEVRTGAERVSIASFFAEMHQNRKNIFEKAGDTLSAQKEEQKVNSLNQFILNSMTLLEEYGTNTMDRIKTIQSYSNTCYAQKKYTEAIKGYLQIISMNPSDLESLNKLALCYLEDGKYDSSKVYYSKTLSIDPKNTNALVGISGALFFTQNYREAIANTKKAIAINPIDGQLYANIAACYLNINKIDSAVFWLRKGLKTKPTPRTYEYLSNCYAAMGKKDSSAYYANKAKE